MDTLDMVRHTPGCSETAVTASWRLRLMPEAGVNSYKVDRRAIDFTLWEHLHVEQVFDTARYSHLSREECSALIDQCVRFATEVLGPLNGPGDRRGLSLRERSGLHPLRVQGRLEEVLRARPRVVRRDHRRRRLRRSARRSTCVLKEAAERRQHRLQHVPRPDPRGGRRARATSRCPRTRSASCPTCSRAASPAPCACPSRTPARTSAPPRPGPSRSTGTSTGSPAPSAGSRPATTTWPRTSSTSCWRASTARRPAPRACRSSSCRSSG